MISSGQNVDKGFCVRFSVQTQPISTIFERRHVENNYDKLHLNRIENSYQLLSCDVTIEFSLD